MRKETLLIITMLILVQLASAESSTFSNWVYSGESTKAGSLSVMMLDAGNHNVRFDHVSGYVTVKNNSCGTTNLLKACVEDMQYDITKRDYKFKVSLTTIEPTIVITRTAAKTTLLAGEEIEISTKIENTGNGEAKNAEFTDDFGNDITVTDASGGLIQEKNKVSWKGSLKASESMTFTYTIKPKQKTLQIFKAEVRYYDGVQTKTKQSSDLKFTVNPAVTVTGTLGTSTWHIGETNNVTINITNLLPAKTNTSKANITKMTIKFDEAMQVTKYPPELKRAENNTFEWSGLVRVNRSQQFFFYAKGIKATETKIYTKAEYINLDGEKRETDEEKTKITVKNRDAKITTNINDLTIESYEEKTIKIWVQNTNAYAKIKDVNVTTSFELAYIDNAFIKEMQPGEYRQVINTKIKALKVSRTTGYKIYVNVSYRTEFGENYSKTLTNTLNIKPVKDVEITQSAGKTAFYTGEEAAINIKVKNPRNVKIKNVRIADKQLEYFTTQGTTSTTTNINKEDTASAYIYIIKAKKVNEEKTENINTTVEYTDDDNNKYYTSKATKLTIKPPALTLTVTKKADETADIYTGDHFYTEYTIKNPSTEQTAFNVSIEFPLQEEVDRIGGEDSYSIGTLGPGEETTIYGKELLRAKANGSIKLTKTKTTYTNEFGDEMNAKSAETTIKVKTKSIEGPYITVQRNCPQEVNNTEEFTLATRVRNYGDNKTKVILEEDGNSWTEIIPANTEINYATKKLVEKAGYYNISQLTATYEYAGKTYRTASNTKEINVIDKPVLAITKNIGETNNIEPAIITITLKAAKEIKNITITDDGETWQISQLSGEKNITYEKQFKTLGKQTLDSAKANYTYKNALYNAKSDNIQTEVNEKQAITITKSATPLELNASQTTKATITIKNTGAQEIKNINIKDMQKEWTINLAAGEEKTLEHEEKLNEAKEYETQTTAEYTYKDSIFTAKSNTVKIRVYGTEAKKEEPIQKEEAPEGILAKILYYLKKIVAFKVKG